MAQRSLISLILRLLVIFGGLFYVLSLPEGQLFSQRITQFLGFTESHPLMRYFSIVDFLVALGAGLLVSHAIFWPCLAHKKAYWPRWGEPALRALDYLWYAGAAAGLIYIAAQAQGQLVAEVRDVREVELDRHQNWFGSSLKDAASRCNSSFSPPPVEASAQHNKAHAFVHAVCAEVKEAGPDLHGELWIIDNAVLSRCDQADVQYWPDSAGPYFPKDLRSNQKLFESYEDFHSVCYHDYHIRRINDRIEEIKPIEAAIAFTGENRLFSGYVTLFAFLLAFRLARTTAEVAEALRSTASRRPNED